MPPGWSASSEQVNPLPPLSPTIHLIFTDSLIEPILFIWMEIRGAL